MSDMELVNIALGAMENAYSIYSGFKVGAALLCADGTVYTGCNVENASFGATNCAERTAVFKAVSEGKRDFKVLAVVGGKNGVTEALCHPCGICRQVLAEFCGADFRIVLFDGENTVSHTLAELLPFAFTPDDVR
jgi:cytidine deaminase